LVPVVSNLNEIKNSIAGLVFQKEIPVPEVVELVFKIKPDCNLIFTNQNQYLWFQPTKPGTHPTLVYR
jgi:hypothetical protein